MARAAGEGGGGGYSPLYKPVITMPAAPSAPAAPVAPRAPASAPAPSAPAAPAASPQIPGAGVYLQQQVGAQKAYDDAMNDINFRRGQMYSEFGLLNNGQVDPNAQHGKYQQMLGNEAMNQHQAKTLQAKRGIGTVGLGARVMGALRQAQGNEQFDFQNTLLNNLHGFDVEGVNAQNTLAQALLAAQQAQEQWAFEHNNFSPADPAIPASPGVPAQSAGLKAATPAKPGTPAKTQLAQHLAAKKAAPARRRP